jgi:hypothetical protein
MSTLTEVKQRKLLAEHQIQHIEDDIAELIRDGKIDRDGGILMVINFEDYWLIHPSELVGPDTQREHNSGRSRRLKNQKKTTRAKQLRATDLGPWPLLLYLEAAVLFLGKSID